MPEPKRILFVDDEANILAGLRRMLRSMRREWDMRFALGGPEALAMMAQEPVDVVVTDMRMPGMDGAQLLHLVMQRHPQTVRIVLSGQADRDAILQAVGPIHQYLSKPCDADTLKQVIHRACALDERLPDPEMKRRISQMETLPSMPTLYRQVVGALQSPEASAAELGRIISLDMGMSAKVLQLVSSAFFGLRPHIPHPSQAVILLGLDTVKLLGLSERVFTQFEQTHPTGLSLTDYWAHSVSVAQFAQVIARAMGAPQKYVDYAYTAGLLHDVGKLVLAIHYPEKYAHAMHLATAQHLNITEAERTVFGPATHAEVGSFLLDLWGLPEPVTRVLQFHHQPGHYPGPDFEGLAAVHAANVIDQQLYPHRVIGAPARMDEAYLASVGPAENQSTWPALCLRAANEGF
jgi:putative nucleotidyltransferase with HDIG domain